MRIRAYKPEDCEALAQLFYDTVHTVNAADYAQEQLDAWADGRENLAAWNQSFLEHKTLVAEEENQIVGFGDIDTTGYLDRLYVHREYQRQGIATALCAALEQTVAGVQITTHASVTAKAFFLGRGYQVVKEQQVIRRGIALTNYVMEKSLGQKEDFGETSTDITVSRNGG